jgi:hypothetical protein
MVRVSAVPAFSLIGGGGCFIVVVVVVVVVACPLLVRVV